MQSVTCNNSKEIGTRELIVRVEVTCPLILSFVFTPVTDPG